MKFLALPTKPKAGRSGRLRMMLLMIGGALLIALIAGFIGVQQWYSSSLKPLNAEASPQLFVVAPGTGADAIADDLETAKLIKSSTAFDWYVRREGVRDKLQAGTYRLSGRLSVAEIVDKLTNGEVATNIVTILPGKRLDEVEDQLVAAGFNREAVERTIGRKIAHPLLVDKPAQASLEGYIFPETYQIAAGTSVEAFLRQTLDIFNSRITPQIERGLKRQGLNFHEAVILASIIQQETPHPEEQVKVAQVFLRRLRIGMPLGADPTFRYAAAILGQTPSPAIESPYNTRIHNGLPPGPIGNFNLDALKAVANPAKTDYLYFVAGDDGVTRFSKTLEEHERLTREYCTELCR